MQAAHPLERAVGMEYYVSDADGVGGRLRSSPADFRVRELEAFDSEPVDADTGASRISSSGRSSGLGHQRLRRPAL